MKLLIAIPALNEQDSIESTIKRSLDARGAIIAKSGIEDVEITVVSDGSTDRTAEIANRYTDRIGLIVFRKNRGYGAAIKEAWKGSNAQLLGFLDADGTCDPEFFGDLCKEIVEKNADLALGSRMHAKSRMPLVRKIGNLFYAFLLSVFSETKVRDSASGMRVVRRSALSKLMPLPDGLHFTPAMSARAVLSKDIKIAEIDMPYDERQGESKLNVLKDGMRFLKVIMESAFLYCPSRVLKLAALACFIYGAALMLVPSVFFLKHQRLEEWMIYRFVVGSLTGIASCVLLCASHLAGRIVEMTLLNVQPGKQKGFFRAKFFWLVPGLFIFAGGALVLPSFLDLLATGHTDTHWSRFMAMSFLVSIAILLAVTRGLGHLLDMVAERIAYLKSGRSAEWQTE